MHVELIGPSELPAVTERPQHLQIDQFQLQRKVDDPDVHRDVAFNICRFPSTVTGQDEELRLRAIEGGPREWDRFSQGSQGLIRPVKHWIVRAFCALLDRHDRGFDLWTDCICNYTTVGPVANNHANERNNNATQLYRKFKSLLEQIGAPTHRENAVRELSDIRVLLKAYWQHYPDGHRLLLGTRQTNE